MKEFHKSRKEAGRPKLSFWLTMSNTGLGNLYEFPGLNSTLKAKNVEAINRHLCGLAIEVAKQPGADDVAKLRGSMCWGYAETHNLLDNAGMFLTDTQAKEFKKYVVIFCRVGRSWCL